MSAEDDQTVAAVPGVYGPDQLRTAPQPVPLSPADCSSATVAALTSAADQLREYGIVKSCGGPVPPELARPGDGVGAGALYAVADWLEARAGLYGWQRPQPVETVVPFSDLL